RGQADGVRIGWGMLLRYLVTALTPLLLALVTLGAVWWYVTIYSQKDNNTTAAPAAQVQLPAAPDKAAPAAPGVQEPPGSGVQEPPSSGGLQEPQGAGVEEPPGAQTAPKAEEGLQALGESVEGPKTAAVPESFYLGFWLSC